MVFLLVRFSMWVFLQWILFCSCCWIDVREARGGAAPASHFLALERPDWPKNVLRRASSMVAGPRKVRWLVEYREIRWFSGRLTGSPGPELPPSFCLFWARFWVSYVDPPHLTWKIRHKKLAQFPKRLLIPPHKPASKKRPRTFLTHILITVPTLP